MSHFTSPCLSVLIWELTVFGDQMNKLFLHWQVTHKDCKSWRGGVGELPHSPVQPVRHLVGTEANQHSRHSPGPPEAPVATGIQEGFRGSKCMQT